jgi:hypothetical protein
MTAPIKPLPCPVCGRKPIISRHQFHSDQWQAVCERITKTADHGIFVTGKTMPAVYKNWNRYVGRKP